MLPCITPKVTAASSSNFSAMEMSGLLCTRRTGEILRSAQNDKVVFTSTNISTLRLTSRHFDYAQCTAPLDEQLSKGDRKGCLNIYMVSGADMPIRCSVLARTI